VQKIEEVTSELSPTSLKIQDDQVLIGKNVQNWLLFLDELKLSIEQGEPTQMIQKLLQDLATKISID